MTGGNERRLAAIVSADVVGYSRLMGADEDGTLASLRVHRAELIDPKITAHGGRIANTAGDGLLLEFPSVVNAVRCVLEIQQGMAERNQGVEENKRITYRIGVNQGDIVIEGDDIHGDGVNVAARLQGIADPGGVSISQRVHEDVRNRLDATFEDIGEQNLKNIARPVRVWQWTPAVSAIAKPKVDDPVPTLRNRPSIAILPFQNLSGDPEQEYFADGMTEDIITELSRFEDLLVLAANTTFAYKGKRVDVKSVAQELGVGFVLEGSLRKAGSRVRITAQLINGRDGSHIWAERYDGALEELFELQEQVLKQVVGNVAPHVTLAEISRASQGERVYDEAHELAWKALELRRAAVRLSDPDMLTDAIEMAKDAVRQNPKIGVAYQVICMGYITIGTNRWGDDPDVATKSAERWSRTFYSELPSSSTAYLYRGLTLMVAAQYQEALVNYQHAHDLNPNDTSVLWWWALCEVRMGEFDSARKHAHMAMELSSKRDPLLGHAYSALATAAFLEGDGAAFEEWATKAIQTTPGRPMTRALMVAHAANIGDTALLEMHKEELMRRSPKFVASLFSGDNKQFARPEYTDMLLDGLRKAGFSG